MNIQKFIRSYQKLLVFGSIILLCVLSGIFGIIPAVFKLIALQEAVRELRGQTQSLRMKLEVLQSLDTEVLEQTLQDLLSAVPSDKSLSSVLSTVDGLAGETGVGIVDFTLVNPGSLATDSARRKTEEELTLGSNLLPFSVTITGSYDQIRKYLDKAVGVRRFFRVRQFDMAVAPEGVLSARLDMDAYYAPFPTDLGGINRPLTLLTPDEEDFISRISALPVAARGIAVPGVEIVSEGVTGKDNPFAP